MEFFEFYKELYLTENNRRNEVQSALSIPIGIVTALVTGMYFLISNFDYKISLCLNIIFYPLCLISTTWIIFSICYLIRAFGGLDLTLILHKKDKGNKPKTDYKGLPYAKQLNDWYSDLQEYYADSSEPIDLAKIHFKKYIFETFVEATNDNMFINDRKYSYIYNSKMYIIYALAVISVTIIPFSYNFFLKNEIKQLEIKQTDKLSESLEKLKYKVEQLEKTNQLFQTTFINYDRTTKRSGFDTNSVKYQKPAAAAANSSNKRR